jgi:hypothetical protein
MKDPQRGKINLAQKVLDPQRGKINNFYLIISKKRKNINVILNTRMGKTKVCTVSITS